MDYIPKTELRFLKDIFSNLKCQAIHCCLTGYNELHSITPEVTKAFLKCIGDSEVTVQIDENFVLVCNNIVKFMKNQSIIFFFCLE